MIIFINGSINSGKTTISKLLAKKLGKVALVDIDKLHEFIAWKDINEAISINLKNAVDIIKNFVHEELDVIVPYPLSQANYGYVTKELSSVETKKIFITLDPTLGVALKKRGSRELSSWEIERIKHHYKIGIPNPSFGTIIDNSKITPEETLHQILKVLGKK
ncbi:MAG: hypothetical protein Q8O88_00625 [bacterium]|nr:hypothetical protein [bacterium]